MIHHKTYFDSAATTPLDPRVREAMGLAQDYWGNENSKHVHGFASSQVIRQSMETIADVLRCSPDQLAVTYSGTDSNRRAIWAMRNRAGLEHCFGSAVEHSSIMDEIPAGQRFDPEYLGSLSLALKQPQSLLALIATNSETGSIYDGTDLRNLFPEACILRDYSQSLAKGMLPDLETADFGTFSPQKIYGPKMIGLTYLRDPQNFQEISKDSHTKSVSQIVGMAKAFEIWESERQINYTQNTKWEYMISSYFEKNIPDIKFHASNYKVPGIINIAFKGIRGGELMTLLSREESIAVSIGSACTSDIMSPTEVIKHIEPDETWQYPIRIGLHKYLDDQVIMDFCEIVAHYVQEMREKNFR